MTNTRKARKQLHVVTPSLASIGLDLRLHYSLTRICESVVGIFRDTVGVVFYCFFDNCTFV